jgi:hypothetical protein
MKHTHFFSIDPFTVREFKNLSLVVYAAARFDAVELLALRRRYQWKNFPTSYISIFYTYFFQIIWIRCGTKNIENFILFGDYVRYGKVATTKFVSTRVHALFTKNWDFLLEPKCIEPDSGVLMWGAL